MKYIAKDGEALLFYVVDSPTDNEELFTTRVAAETYADTLTRSRIRICEVYNAYNDGDGWNYDDYSNTFHPVITLQRRFTK